MDLPLHDKRGIAV